MFYSVSTSPLYEDGFLSARANGDSSQFLTIGREWLNGELLYRDIFDHKGPYIFLFNMIGWAITDSPAGVCYLQIINMAITLYGIYKIAMLSGRGRIFGIIAAAAAALAVYPLHEMSNTCEEVSLPFIVFSTYLQLKYLMPCAEIKDCGEHNKFHAFFYGISFAICFFIKVTQSITICAGVLVIVLILLSNKKYKNILQNAVFFILGAVIVALPFCIYFLVNGNLYDLFYYSFISNIKYSNHAQSWLISLGKNRFSEIYNFFLNRFSYMVIFLCLPFYAYQKQKVMTMYCAVCMALETYLFFSGYNFSHYALITIAQIPIYMNAFSSLRFDSKFIKKLSFVCFSLCLGAVCFYNLNTMIKDVNTEFSQKPSESTNDYAYIDKLVDQIPDDEMDELTFYGYNRMKAMYLKYDIRPCYKYFAIQDWEAEHDDRAAEEIHDIYLNGDAKWLLTDDKTETIQDTLATRYNLMAQVDKYYLYRLIE